MADEEISLDSYRLYTIAWVATLSVERAAAEAMLDEEHEEPDDFEQHHSDNNQYSWGRMGAHNIVIASLPKGVYGTTSAAVTVSQLSSSLPHIKIGLLVGIAGAIPQITKVKDASGAETENSTEILDIRLGDIVVGQPDGRSGGVVQYDLGKNGQAWERTGALNPPPAVLLAALSKLDSDHKRGRRKVPQFLTQMWERNPYMATAHGPKDPSFTHQGFASDRLFKPEYDHPPGETDCNLCESWEQVVRHDRSTTDPKIHYGVIASGNTLVKGAAVRERIAQSTGERCLCFEMESAGIVSHFPCLVIRGICDYSDTHKNDCWQPYASATAAAYAKELLSHVSAKKLTTTVSISEIEALHESVAQVQALAQETNTRIDELRDAADSATKRTLLSHLPVSAEARYNSYTEGSSPLCLRNTRVQVLSDIFNWVERDNSPTVFWLHGMAGTGKSTIARTFAKILDERGQLGASFFFRRGEADRNTIRQLSSTIAADLALRHPTACAQILQSISDDPNICTKAAYQQFKSLILEPLSSIKSDEPIVIVLDALDECDEAELLTFFSLVSDFTSANLRSIKLFLTSRPDRDILRGFGNYKEFYENIELHNIEKSVIEHDILIYLKHELGLIRDNYNNRTGAISKIDQDWPIEGDAKKLMEMANRLFIFAATICRLLNEGIEGSPASQLHDILSYTARTGHAFEATYLPVLHRQLPKQISKSQEKTVIGQITLILGALTVLTDPLSLPALARFVDLDIGTVQHRLDSLRSVIEIVFLDDPNNPEASQIRFLHLSFRDYLLSWEIRDVSPIWVDENEAHSTISANCLRVLNRPVGGLQLDICNLKIPGTPRSSVTKDHVHKCMASELRYACRNLSHHLNSATYCIVDHDTVHEFLLHHFLNWLEALSFLGLAFEALKSIQALQDLICPENSGNVKLFLSDSIHFILANVDMLDSVPLQIYSSALIFAPRRSVIRSIFRDRYTSWIKKSPTIQDDWGIELQHVKAHHERVRKIFFSPDESLIASISGNEIGIFTTVGKRLLALAGTTEPNSWPSEASVVAAFSPDSRFIAVGDGAENIQIWNIAASKCMQLLQTSHREERSWKFPISFTDCGSYILTTSPSRTERWSLKTGAIVQSTTYPHTAIRTVLSPCKSVIAVQFGDRIILWNINSGEQIRSIACGSNWIDSVGCNPIKNDRSGSFEVVLVPNLDIWAVMSSGERCTVHITSPVSPQPLHSAINLTLEPYTFVDDYLLVAKSGQLNVWNILTGELYQTVSIPREVDTLAYSPKSSLLVATTFSVSELNGVIFFWRLEICHTNAISGGGDTAITNKTLERIRNKGNYFITPSCGLLGYDDHCRIHLWRAHENQARARIIEADRGQPVIVSSTDRFLATADNHGTGTVTIWQLDPTPTILNHLTYRIGYLQYLSLIFFSPDSTVMGLVIDSHRFDLHNSRVASIVRLFSVRTGEPLSDIVLLPAVYFSWPSYGACMSSDHLLLAVSGPRYAIVLKLGHEGAGPQVALRASGEYAFRSSGTEDTPIALSPDSSLLLFIPCGVLEIWHVSRQVCLRRISRCPIFHATIMPQESIILTDVGKISYHFDSHGLTETLSQDLTREDEFSTARKPLGYLFSGSTPKMIYNWVGWGISDDRCWITWYNDNWLRLPLGFRPCRSVIKECSILIASEESGENWYEFVQTPVLEDCLREQYPSHITTDS